MGLKHLLAALWASLFAVALVAWLRSGIAADEVPALLEARLHEFGLLQAAVVYVVLYTLRPLVLFPAAILTIASGLIFGPWLGILFTTIGENASANFAFFLARWLGRDWIQAREVGSVPRWERRLAENGLVSVLIMRLLYLPFDAVNYGCGLTSMRQRDFTIGTFIGIIPGMVSFVFFGGAAASGVEHRLWVLAGAVFFFVLGLLIARWLRASALPVEETADESGTA